MFRRRLKGIRSYFGESFRSTNQKSSGTDNFEVRSSKKLLLGKLPHGFLFSCILTKIDRSWIFPHQFVHALFHLWGDLWYAVCFFYHFCWYSTCHDGHEESSHCNQQEFTSAAENELLERQHRMLLAVSNPLACRVKLCNGEVMICHCFIVIMIAEWSDPCN